MRELAYQERVLETLDTYLAALKTHKANADAVAAVAAANPKLTIPVPDFTAEAWAQMQAEGRLPGSRAGHDFSPRKDGCGRPVPNVTLKVPTGGGKTYLATHGVSRVLGGYLASNTGFVLWIVPNEAIYSQTLRRLKDRQDPYRQVLDRAAAGRVKILEKSDTLDRRDIDANLCIMVLMLQSANRETQDSLKIFKDRGDVHGFTPPGQQDEHARLLRETPNLAIYDLADNFSAWPMVKDSLGNALRLIRPIVVVDEGQKAVSDLAFRTLHDFNPVFVLELTATPKDVAGRQGANGRQARNANLLVEVTGKELDAEGMIKMPINLDPRQGLDWKATLNAGVEKLKELQAVADRNLADGGDYIRPIMLVQVEQTGDDQRGRGRIHAQDVRDRLLQIGFDPAEIAIKTAQQNDLNNPENQDLLSRTNRVRVIVTKQALQEGWDCPFAYVLCALAASSNVSAMTQLVGRILRQPWAKKTGVPMMDEAHIITHHAGTAEVVAAIKKGLEADGLSDLVVMVKGRDGSGAGAGVFRQVERRDKFRTTDIYLPKVMIVDGAVVRELDYDADLLVALDWTNFDPSPIAARIPDNPHEVVGQLQRIRLADTGDERFVTEGGAEVAELRAFDAAFATRSIGDLILNPFVARAIVGDVLAALRARGFDDEKIGRHAGLILDELRRGLDAERTARAEALFRAGVAAGRIQFRLRVDSHNWQMPKQIETALPANAQQLVNQNGGPLERSLFAPVYHAELNGEERDVAVHLDATATVEWWHRNVARTQYGLQGWRRSRIYPDFIFAATQGGGNCRIIVLETKGDQLAANLDTTYKAALLSLLSEHFDWNTTVPAGELQLVTADGATVECDLVLMSDIPTKLPRLVNRGLA
ncbi:type III restriction endonuclease subunit R [Mesorhizobium sp. B2-4-4]|uniref:DEAD/DEAH box helicase n=1 Tax=Mesorhizobium sp. B2-4-4 TaxID=2589945 RepID=UPI0011273765|nr:DEAD/DEAH box helicase family protein [Mesorhizobium sp. B2-4-4]TPL53361.1 type III restriction endonuclease subunit R [Mesorhizobium sp. B2-4-4]